MSYNDDYPQRGYGDDSYGSGERRGGYGQDEGYGNERRHHGRGEGGYGDESQGYGREGQGYGNEQEGYGGERRHHGGGEYGGRGDEYGGGGRGYGGGGDPSEYGGGGRGSDNYYNQSGDFASGRHHGGGEYDDDDLNGAMQHAQRHGGSGEDPSLFGNALGFLSNNRSRIGSGDMDEQQAIRAHQAMYGGGGYSGGGGEPHSSETMGTGAAMQALKMFTGGGAGHGGMGGMGGGNSQNQFVGMAMGQASKLFDQQSAQGRVVCFLLLFSASSSWSGLVWVVGEGLLIGGFLCLNNRLPEQTSSRP